MPDHWSKEKEEEEEYLLQGIRSASPVSEEEERSVQYWSSWYDKLRNQTLGKKLSIAFFISIPVQTKWPQGNASNAPSQISKRIFWQRAQFK
jgi:hypothetical protein